MAVERLSRPDAVKLLRECVRIGKVILGKHFRDELAHEGLIFPDALRVLKSGQIYQEPEPDPKTGEWKYRVEGREVGRQMARHRVLFQGHGHRVSDHRVFRRGKGKATMKKAECSNCGSETKIVRGNYDFKETGLRGLVLLDIELLKCGKCGNVDPVLFQVDELMHIAAVAILQKPYRLQGEELRFLRKHIDLSQEEFAKLLRVNKTTLSKWENSEDPIGIQSDLLARMVVISRDKRLEKRAADHIRAFEKIANKQKRVRMEVDVKTHEFEYA